MKIEKIFSQQYSAMELQYIKMTNRNGAQVVLCNVGAGIVSIEVPDRNGNLVDVALGYKNPADYFGDAPCMGKTPGRCANRIAYARFTLNEKEYHLDANINGIHHLHGGANGFANQLWETYIEEDSVSFQHISPDGAQGYPASIEAKVTYRWNEDNQLIIQFHAVSSDDTVVNLTNHVYFNLAGENSGSVLEHTLQLNASQWLPANNELIVTGEIADVAETPMDFRIAKPIGRDIYSDFDALKKGKGYDSCWVINGWSAGKLCPVAILSDEKTGITLEVFSTQPGVQIYTGNWLSGSPESKSGRSYNDYDGIAIECQAFPDSPNKPHFPSVVLRKNDCYEQTIIFQFQNS